SPAGVVASAGRDGDIRLWARDGGGLRELLYLRHGKQIRQIAFLADGMSLAVLPSSEWGVRVWRLNELWRSLAELRLHRGLPEFKPRPSPRRVTITPPPCVVDRAAGPNGLKAVLCDSPDWTRPVKERIDGSINFNWAQQAPDPLVTTQTCSARWTGRLVPP